MNDIIVKNSSSVAEALILGVVCWTISVGGTAMLAARMNRSVVGWAILGGAIFPGTGLVLLLFFMSYLCPKCRAPILPEEAKLKDCPRCRNIRPKQKDSDYVECPSCGAMIPPHETKCPKCGWSYEVDPHPLDH